MGIRLFRLLLKLRDLSGKSSEVELSINDKNKTAVNNRTKQSFKLSEYESDITAALTKPSHKGYIEFTEGDYQFKLTYNGLHIVSAAWGVVFKSLCYSYRDVCNYLFGGIVF